MPAKVQPPTTEMQVTSIRLERSLIDKLKALSGDSGYQSLLRNILWSYVNQHTSNTSQIRREDIRTVMPAEAHRTERCALTGREIVPFEEIWMALTTDNILVPLSIESIEES